MDERRPAQLARLRDEARPRTRCACCDADPEPRPGALYLLRATASHGIEWLLLEAVDGGFLAVPADTVPLAGRDDLVLRSPALGSLTVRCGHAVWLGGDRLEPELRSGCLSAGDLARARERRRCHDADPVSGAGSGADDGDVARDPEYREWLEVLADAQARARAGGRRG